MPREEEADVPKWEIETNDESATAAKHDEPSIWATATICKITGLE